MMFLLVTVLFVSFTFVEPKVIQHGLDKDQSLPRKSQGQSWDLIVLSQTWPVSECREWRDKDVSHKCTLPYSWTVHGLWPGFQGSSKYPQFCNKSWHFDPEEIKTIEKDLIDHWTNIEVGTPQYQFWAHEWNKHGTCAATQQLLNSQFKYFKQGLTWNQMYNFTRVLSEAEITPSNSKEYLVTDIQQAIIKKFAVDPTIQCYKKGGRNYLVEIRLCFNRSLKLINCSSNDEKILTNCSGSKIIYPKDTELLESFTRISNESKQFYQVVRI